MHILCNRVHTKLFTMQKQYIISIVLDRRRIKKNGTFPVRLRVFMPEIKKQKLYNTVFSFTEKDFKNVWETLKVKSEYKEYKAALHALEKKADDVAKELPAFTFEDFERLMFGNTGTKRNVSFFFQKIIADFTEKGSISTAKGYNDAFNCISRFANKSNLNFKDITVSFLEGFERFCINEENKSITTVSMYTRNLRAVFNKAIAEKVISQEIYPFGKNKYKIKTSSNVKKALTADEVKLLFQGMPKTPEQEQAKAFWFFSYLCNGMNVKDIIELRCKDVDDEKITFVRSKTEKTTSDVKAIEVYLNDYSRKVIDEYGNKCQSPKDYVFPVLSKGMSSEVQRQKKLNFISFINDHFDKYAKDLGFKEKITTYWARHTFSTVAINKGMSIEFVGEALGHTDIKTTMNYFKGFEQDSKKKITDLLLDF